MIGENPLTAEDLDIVGALASTLTPPMTKLFRQLCDGAQSHILKAKWRQKYYADAHRRAVEYTVCDQVWPSSKHIPALNHCSKFVPKYRGLFTMTERIGTVAYRLALPPTYEGHNVFHVSQLVPHHPSAPTLVTEEAPVGWPPTRDEAGNPTGQYLVDYILDQNGTGGEAYYSSGGVSPRKGPHGNRHITSPGALLYSGRGRAASTNAVRPDRRPPSRFRLRPLFSLVASYRPFLALEGGERGAGAPYRSVACHLCSQ
ncbi:Disease resistance protein, related [Eimeria brunetti]|uniref:Disease resistance protein, related n=1 Tax=Eimeria brunetti TaxID=51314 RepID=U6LB36_9EIME|nr:Disease resistance protein, related [Eimeria brunetti]